MTPAQYSREGEQQDRNGDEGGTEAAEYGSKSLTYQSGTGHIHQYGTGIQVDQSGGQNCESCQCTYDHGVGEDFENAPHTLAYGLFYVGTGMHHNGGTKAGFVGEHAALHAPGQSQLHTGTYDTAAHGAQTECSFENSGKYGTHVTDICKEDYQCTDDISDGHKGNQLLGDSCDSF